MIVMLTAVMPRVIVVVPVMIAVVVALARFNHTTGCQQNDGHDKAALRDTL